MTSPPFTLRYSLLTLCGFELSCLCVQGARVVCGTKRQHSSNMETSAEKKARIDTDAQDMDLDESGMLCFVCSGKLRLLSNQMS